jgi:hypothetical protein
VRIELQYGMRSVHVGLLDGTRVGRELGVYDGSRVGLVVGEVGKMVGEKDGRRVGVTVRLKHVPQET